MKRGAWAVFGGLGFCVFVALVLGGVAIWTGDERWGQTAALFGAPAVLALVTGSFVAAAGEFDR